MKNVAIIGAGFTGLRAAYELSKLGYSVDIYEKEKNIGGLGSSFKISNNTIEKAYHHIFPSDNEVINFSNELGIKDTLSFYPSSVSNIRNNTILPFSGIFDILKYSPLSILNRIRFLFASFLLSLQSAEKKTHFPALKTLKKYYGKTTYKELIDPLFEKKFHSNKSTIPLSFFLARLQSRRRKQSLFGEKLGYFHGGFYTLEKAITRKLKEFNVKIHHTSVKKISFDKTPIITTSNTTTPYNSILVTTSNDTFLNLTQIALLENSFYHQLKDTQYFDHISVVFTLNKSLYTSYWNQVLDNEIPFLTVIEHTNLVSSSHYDNNHVYYIGAYLKKDDPLLTLSTDTIANLFFEHLHSFTPQFSKEEIIEKHVHILKNASYAPPLDTYNVRPPYKTPLNGVFLANYTQIIPHDRGVNYALIEGAKIAKRIDKFLSVQK